jgi:hypothetical protein
MIVALPVLAGFLYVVFSDPWWSTRPSDVAALQQKGVAVDGTLVVLKIVLGGLATTVAFAIPWAIIQMVGWIVEGFKQTKK